LICYFYGIFCFVVDYLNENLKAFHSSKLSFILQSYEFMTKLQNQVKHFKLNYLSYLLPLYFSIFQANVNFFVKALPAENSVQVNLVFKLFIAIILFIQVL